MLDYKDILNKHFVLRLSAREISRQTGVSKSGILKFLQSRPRFERDGHLGKYCTFPYKLYF